MSATGLPDDLVRAMAKDPLVFGKTFWPHIDFFDKQAETTCSVRDNRETVVHAGEQLGKDFNAAFVNLWGFLSHPVCRIVTTSVAERHLNVLWGEINRFIQTSVIPLTVDRGGPLIVNDKHLRKVPVRGGPPCPISYLIGAVSAKGEGLSGHHAPWTLLTVDEASAMDDKVIEHASGWAKRIFLFGNCWPSEGYFRKAVKEGDIRDNRTGKLLRKVIKISARDSPNVRLGLEEQARGREPSGTEVVPGVLSWDEYQVKLQLLDAVLRCIKLDAEFYEGAVILLFPPAVLDRAERMAEALRGRQRKARGIGVDPAEGGDLTALCAVDEYGIIELVARKTPDTNVVVGEIIAFMKKHQCDPERVVLDAGGGKVHADRLRAQGYPVRTIGFGSAPMAEIRRRSQSVNERKDVQEDRYAYVMRNAQMYHELSLLLELDGQGNPIGELEVDGKRLVHGFAIPAEYTELRKELAVFPKLTDERGRYYLPPKKKKDPDSKIKTLTEMIGHSPDRADSLCLATAALLHKSSKLATSGFGI